MPDETIIIIVRLARYGSPVQYRISSADRWSIRVDDPDVGKFSETVCREAPPHMELVPSIGGILWQTTLSTWLQATVHSFSILAATPSSFSVYARRGCVEPSGSCADDGGPNEDRPEGSSSQSQRRSESGQITGGPLEAR